MNLEYIHDVNLKHRANNLIAELYAKLYHKNDTVFSTNYLIGWKTSRFIEQLTQQEKINNEVFAHIARGLGLPTSKLREYITVASKIGSDFEKYKTNLLQRTGKNTWSAAKQDLMPQTEASSKNPPVIAIFKKVNRQIKNLCTHPKLNHVKRAEIQRISNNLMHQIALQLGITNPVATSMLPNQEIRSNG